MCFLFAGCSSQGYRYVDNGGNPYISLNYSYSSQLPDNGSASIEAPTVYFSSVEEMKNDIKGGIFTEDELNQISQFPRNSKGKIDAPNVNTLDVSLPESIALQRIAWGGSVPFFHINVKDGSGDGELREKPKEDIQKDLDKKYFNRSSVDKIEEIPEANGKTAGKAYYFTSPSNVKMKDIQYEVSAKDITYYVQEQYTLTSSKAERYFIKIWAIGANTSFEIVLADFGNQNLPQLTVDEITAFLLSS